MAKEYEFGVSLFGKEEEEELEQQPQEYKPYEFGKSILDPEVTRQAPYSKPSIDLITGEVSGDIPAITKPGAVRKAIDIGEASLKQIPINARKMINGLQDTYANEFLSEDLSYDPTKPTFVSLGEFALSRIPALRSTAEDILKENEKEYKQLERKLRKMYKDTDLSETDMAIASGLSSFLTQAPLLLASALTRNPKLAYTSLGYFGLQEKGISYKEARQAGLSHEEAVRNSNINAALEI